jgi:hypothetical protein
MKPEITFKVRIIFGVARFIVILVQFIVFVFLVQGGISGSFPFVATDIEESLPNRVLS